MTFPCPVPLCTNDRGQDFYLTCSTHWKALPEETRRRLWKAYRERRRNPKEHIDATREALAYLRERAGVAA